MLITAGSILIGLGLLAWGADRFVAGAAAVARNLRVSPMLIGLTILGVATSAPEMLVSALAAFNGMPAIAIGNAVGSNIANLGLVLGAAIVVRPLAIRSSTLQRELPALLLSAVLPLLVMLDGRLGRVDSLLLLAALLLLGWWLTALGYRAGLRDPLRAELRKELREPLGRGAAAVWLVLGLAALLAGAQLLVVGAERAARALDVSELIIGLTVVAIGTSLPELAVSVAGARKNEADLVLGSIIGSNIFNMLAVIGIAGIVAPLEIEAEMLTLHYPVMGLMTLAVFLLTYNRGSDHILGRNIGLALLSAFSAYHAFVVWRILAA
jgi:cation:H+ antiporter